MYVGEHVDSRLCPVCGDNIADLDEYCYICWHGTERGILVKDDAMGVWVHRDCLAFFGVDDVVQFEKQYFDL